MREGITLQHHLSLAKPIPKMIPGTVVQNYYLLCLIGSHFTFWSIRSLLILEYWSQDWSNTYGLACRTGPANSQGSDAHSLATFDESCLGDGGLFFILKLNHIDRTRYGVSFMNINSDAYFASVIVVPYEQRIMWNHIIMALDCIRDIIWYVLI